MAVSQNGWPANDRSLLTNLSVPGGRLLVRAGDVATVLGYVADRFDAEVEPLVWPGCWGYAPRPIRGGQALSNHASGTAIDLNAPRHPLGRVGTFSRAQVAAIHAILADLDGSVRWGGDYHGRKDEMHFEVVASRSELAAVARNLTDPLEAVMAWYKDKDAFEVALRANVRNAPITLPTGKTMPLQEALSLLYRIGAENQRRITAGPDVEALAEAIAAKIAARIPPGGVADQGVIEAALREVLGSLDQEV